jgi:hypothetical protein
MGGPGSTRWSHHHRKPLAEDSLRLDVEHFRRNPEAAFEEIQRRGPRARLALDLLPKWLTGFDSHPGGKQFCAQLLAYLADRHYLGDEVPA